MADQLPLSLRLTHLLLKEARPSVKDFVVGFLVAIAAIAVKIHVGDLTWAVTWRNFVEALFPIVAALVVFLVFHTVKAARDLIVVLRLEQGEEEYDLYPTLVLPERITAVRKTEIPHFRSKVVFLAGAFIAVFISIGIISWKLSSVLGAVGGRGETSVAAGAPSPSPSVVALTLPSPSLVTSSPSTRPDIPSIISINPTSSAGKSYPPAASLLNPYQAFQLHKSVPDIQRTFIIRPTPFVKLEIPVKIDAEKYLPERQGGHALVIYIGKGKAEQDVEACLSFIHQFKEIQQEMDEALQKSEAREKYAGLANAVVIYHAGAFTKEQDGRIRGEAQFHRIEVISLNPVPIQ